MTRPAAEGAVQAAAVTATAAATPARGGGEPQLVRGVPERG
jgi:hypothetical protein